MSDVTGDRSPGPSWARLCATDAVNEGQARAFDARLGRRVWSVILVRLDGRLHAYENLCPHAGMPLDRPDGVVSLDLRGYLVCAAHLASFVVETGAFAGGPAAPGERGLRRARIQELEDGFWVDTAGLAG